MYICFWQVTNSPNYNITDKDRDPDNEDGSVLKVNINVADVDDNPPIWGGGGGAGGGSSVIGDGTSGVGGMGNNNLVAGESLMC